MSRWIFLSLLLAACQPRDVELGEFRVSFQDAGLTVEQGGRELLWLNELSVGQGEASVQHAYGSYLFEDETLTLRPAASLRRVEGGAELRDADGEVLGTLTPSLDPSGRLLLRLVAVEGNRARAQFACTGQDQFLGAGSHAFDVEHGGERLALWVSEPGIGKVADEAPPDDWFLTGTRHASSYPDPFLLRPAEPLGVTAHTGARLELDLCSAQDWSLMAWDSSLELAITAGETPLEVIERNTLAEGAPPIAPDWAFAAWNDAVRGVDRVLTVARELRESGASSSVIWTEDWKGAEQLDLGYHLSGEWTIDEALYPQASAIDAQLEAAGFKWFAYFSPFVEVESEAWAEAEDLVIRDEAGQPYTFLNPTFRPVSVLDLSRPEAREWAQGKMQAAVDVGFDGWMADYAEWLPTDAVMQSLDALSGHNLYPGLWQDTNAAVLDGVGGLAFSRSGWTGSPAKVPSFWLGDQRTSFDADDGFPTVIPLGIGAAIAGVAMIGHDIGGYQSIGNEPSDRELWWRWCGLGAFSPVMRTHHGAFDSANWQFDSDAETLAVYAAYSQEHARLYPYLRGLMQLAHDRGRPMILHPALVVPGYDWAAMDAWMLGDALFVAPVLEQGATGREVELPDGADWYDWWTGAPAQAGWYDAAPDQIPVFARGGTLVPTLAEAPDTFALASDGSSTLAGVDAARLIRVFGADGSFEEGDGTRYTTSGVASAAGSAAGTLSSGDLEVNGLTVHIEGTISRSYTVEVWP